MAKTESGKSSKTSERRSPKKKEGSPALQAKDEGSEESKFNPRMREAYLQKVVPAQMQVLPTFPDRNCGLCGRGRLQMAKLDWAAA